MALIKCHECQNQVSSTATACPHCGAPILGSVGAGSPLSTVQLTSKSLKMQIILSLIVFFIGVLLFLNSFFSYGEGSGIYGFILFVGIIWFIITKMRIWWHHK